MSTLRHKHGCNQECYNMHVLSHCTNKKKVSCQTTPQRQISVSTCFTTCVRQHITPGTKLAITVFTWEQDEVFSLKFGTQIREVTLNMHMTCWTASCQTGSLCTRSCKPNHGLHQQIIVWDLNAADTLQHWAVIPYKCFGTTYQSHLQGSRIPKQQSTSEVNWHNLPFWDFVHPLIV